MKKIFLFVGIISMVTLSCNKETFTNSNTNTTPVSLNDGSSIETNITAIVAPSANFKISFNGNGGYTTTSPAFVNSFPEAQSAIALIAANLNSATTMEMSVEGIVTSNNTEFNGKTFMAVLTTYGNFHFAAAENLTITYDKGGFKSISNFELLEILPMLEQKLIDNGKFFSAQMKDGKDIVVSVSANGELLINGVVINTISEDLVQWNQCIRYWSSYWIPPAITIATCAYTLFL